MFFLYPKKLRGRGGGLGMMAGGFSWRGIWHLFSPFVKRVISFSGIYLLFWPTQKNICIYVIKNQRTIAEQGFVSFIFYIAETS